ncbi:MAG: TetR/AcrR family transcriptional regulator [Ruminococcaceae bacterium]|nr:TetR/AcrR family transcriptional regulator [Oscillospiraceae bacterium]
MTTCHKVTICHFGRSDLMCTETFLRLPEEKRERFLDAAWEEFTQTGFADASINQIVRRAGVPRGSFYQYFSDKDDLFSYLGNIILKHLVAEYRGVMRKAEGDIFRTQLLCFDRVATHGSAADLLFERSLRIVRKNPGLLPQAAMQEQVLYRIFAEVREDMDVSLLRQQDETFVWHTFALAIVAVAIAVVACLENPEKAESIRCGLVTQLDIMKNGSLAEPCRESL